LKELKFNVEATRKTITYNAATKEIDYSLKPSRSFADAVLHQYVLVYGRDPAELDLDSLYQIDKNVKNTNKRLGYFDFSFDDIDVSLGQRIETICNAARVYVYRDGQKWRFARNEEKLRAVAMFNALNTFSSSDGGTIQKKSSLPTTYDGIQVQYIDSSKDQIGGTDKKTYIDLKIKNNKIVNGQAFRPLKIELAGCRNYDQAMNRAQLEIRRLIYERTFIEDEVINDANFIDKGDLVLWSDTYDETIISGEVVRINNNTFYVDQELELDSGKNYRVAITDKSGYPSDWINIKSHTHNSFTADYSTAYVADNINIQMGSIFIITETISSEPTEFLLTEKIYNDNGTYKIKLINYDSRIYEYDRESGFFSSGENI
ncbi:MULTISPECIES: host specificity factor TipJ family phage tail protein, partial [unclassified Gilliamella]